MQVTVEARSNIALVKYWGKRDAAYNLPAAGSLSVTLDGLNTRTTVEFVDAARDVFVLNDSEFSGKRALKLTGFVDIIRGMASIESKVRMTSHNDFPTAAGLASSASGFAALALAASRAAGLDLSERELSALARRGSGSAARSIPGGFVVWHRGVNDDGSDSFAESIAPPDAWDLNCLVLVTALGEKDVPSTRGMNHTMATSPFYDAWIESVDADLRDAAFAIGAKDFEFLAEVAERSCLTMHASAMAARPGVLYWNGATVSLIQHVRRLRAAGRPCFFTIDAGPHVKVFCEASARDTLVAEFQQLPEVMDIIIARPGKGAEVLR